MKNKSIYFVLFTVSVAVFSIGAIVYFKRNKSFYKIPKKPTTIPEPNKSICNDDGCYGRYVGVQFTNKDGDIAHQYSNTFQKIVEGKIREEYTKGNYFRAGINSMDISVTPYIGYTTMVDYQIWCPLIRVKTKCEARTGFTHSGGWGRPESQDLKPELEKRKKTLLSQGKVVDNILEISKEYKSSKQGKSHLREYWINYMNNGYQSGC